MAHKNIGLCLIILCSAFSMLAVSFTKKAHEEIFQKEYKLADGGTLKVENLGGAINIKTEWDQKTIVLTAIKTAQSPEQLAATQIIAEQTNGSSLTIRTIFDPKMVKGAVDFELVVPTNVNLNLLTHRGSIFASQITGPVRAVTTEGAIDLCEIHGDVDAMANKAGSITISRVSGDVTAGTRKGNIAIVEPRHNVRAKTSKGSVDLYCQQAPTKANLWLKANKIDVHLPRSTNATVQAMTEKGAVTCQHDLLVQPFVTKLDKKAWGKFTREINGVLGKMDDSVSQVKLFATNGIRILETA